MFSIVLTLYIPVSVGPINSNSRCSKLTLIVSPSFDEADTEAIIVPIGWGAINWLEGFIVSICGILAAIFTDINVSVLLLKFGRLVGLLCDAVTDMI